MLVGGFFGTVKLPDAHRRTICSASRSVFDPIQSLNIPRTPGLVPPVWPHYPIPRHPPSTYGSWLEVPKKFGANNMLRYDMCKSSRSNGIAVSGQARTTRREACGDAS